MEVTPLFSLLADCVSEFVDALGAVMIVAQKEPFFMDAHPASHRVRLWRGGSASNHGVEVVPLFSLLADGGWRFDDGCGKMRSLGFTKTRGAISLVCNIHRNCGLLDRAPPAATPSAVSGR